MRCVWEVSCWVKRARALAGEIAHSHRVDVKKERDIGGVCAGDIARESYGSGR